jgi:hypothetical protein
MHPKRNGKEKNEGENFERVRGFFESLILDGVEYRKRMHILRNFAARWKKRREDVPISARRQQF